MRTHSHPFLLPTAFAAVAAFTACGGGSAGSKAPELDAQRSSFARDTANPEIILRGRAADAHFWTDGNGDAVAGFWSSKVTPDDVRVTWTPAGIATRIDNAATGAFLLLQQRSPSRIDCIAYDSDARFTGGFALVQTTSGCAWANIVARSPFAGQLTGQITLPTMSGSYTLITEAVQELGPLTELASNFIDASRWAAGDAVLTGQELVLAINLCAIAHAPNVLGTQWQAPCAAAAALRLLAGVRGHSLLDCIDNQFELSDPVEQECIDLALSQLSDEASPPLADFWLTWAANLADGNVLTLAQVAKLRAAFEPSTTPLAGVGELVLPAFPVPPIGGPQLVAVAINGQAILQSGAFYPLSGTVSQTGSLNCSGLRDGTTPTDQMVCMGQIDDDDFTGVCTVAGTTGTMGGTSTPLGECDTANESGGQGTYTFAHYIGPGQGTVAFNYEAFSIPDQFIVRTSAGERFNTGALVSGGAQVPIALDNEPVVFVSVRAPNASTLWRYSLGCLQ